MHVHRRQRDQRDDDQAGSGDQHAADASAVKLRFLADG